MSSRLSFSDLAKRIHAKPCAQAFRLVAIDGGAGAGKSTFAARLARALGGAPVIQVDDFITFLDFEHWWPRLEAEVLKPLFRGQPARYQIRDWVGDVAGPGLLNEWKTCAPAPIILLEGVTSSRRVLGPRLHYAVWVEAPRDLRRARGLARDKDVESAAALWDRFLPGEAAFFAADKTRDRADIRVDGTAPWNADGFGLQS